MNKILLKLWVVSLFLFSTPVLGQQVGLNTHLDYWSTITPKLDFEVAFNTKVMLELTGDGHFLGIHGLFAGYNVDGLDIPILPFTGGWPWSAMMTLIFPSILLGRGEVAAAGGCVGCSGSTQ